MAFPVNFLRRLVWQQGTANDRTARRHRLTGEVQYLDRRTETRQVLVCRWVPFASRPVFHPHAPISPGR